MTPGIPGLKPCPFCGGTAQYENSDLSNHEWIACTSCGASAGVQEWSRRAALSTHHEDGGSAATSGVVVPMEATEAMLAAVRKRAHPTRPDGWDAHHAALWRAMLSAHQAAGVAP